MRTFANEVLKWYFDLHFDFDSTFTDEIYVYEERDRLYMLLESEITEDEKNAIMSAAKEWIEFFEAKTGQMHPYIRKTELTIPEYIFLEETAEGIFAPEEQED